MSRLAIVREFEESEIVRTRDHSVRVCDVEGCDNLVLDAIICRRCAEELEALEHWDIDRSFRRQERREKLEQIWLRSLEAWLLCWDFARKYAWVLFLILGAWVMTHLAWGLIYG